MGIPAFAKTITNKYPQIITNTIRSKCGRLFLDLNCAIHPVAQRAMQQYKNDKTYEQTVIQNVIQYIQTIVSFVEPQQLMFVAIDGIPPRAKMHQQRKRRYMSSWRKDVIAVRTGKNPFPWDTNAITPGTRFMNDMSAILHDHFDKANYPFRVILRDSNTPGEGEAKIMDHIREDVDVDVNMHDIIYGLDADLIMLSLASIREENKNPQIYLLREPTHYDIKNCSKPFLYFDIKLLYGCIEKELGKNRVWDYVSMCFLLGNDFMPPLSYLKIKNKGIDKVLDAYRSATASTGDDTSKSYLVSADGKLHLDVLMHIIDHLKEKEDEELRTAEEVYYKETESRLPRTHDIVQKVSQELDTYPMKHKAKSVRPEKNGWRLYYYDMLFKTTDIRNINDICMNYLEAFVWTHAYYFTRPCLSFDWLYRFEYSPTALDLNNFMLSMESGQADSIVSGNIRERYPKIDYNTDLQLLVVLPPKSKQLLKPALQMLMTDIKLGCVHMFPKTFSIGTYLKTFLWECHPDLPAVDVAKVLDIARSVEEGSA
jgi:5'-3' exonuclease